MIVSAPRIVSVPSRPERVRVEATVAYDDGHDAETWWFETDRQYESELSDSGNPWIACAIPLAVTLGQPLRVEAPVDPTLLSGVSELMRLWGLWFKGLRPVSVCALTTNAQAIAGRTAVFFSGGVDSFFSLLTANKGEGDDTSPIDLITVWGFDVPLSNAEAFGRMSESLRQAAGALGKAMIEVATNLRTTRFEQTDWGNVSHAGALAAVGLLFEKRFRQILVGSTHGYRDLSPWGSHPLIDPLYSTAATRMVHDGASYTRVEKTRMIAESDVALRHLRVCWKHGLDSNCGRCSKCLRTMATLYLLNVLDRARSFDGRCFDVRHLRRVYLCDNNDRSFMAEVRELSIAQGRWDVVRAIRRSVHYSFIVNCLLQRIGPLIDGWARSQRVTARLRHHLLRRAII